MNTQDTSHDTPRDEVLASLFSHARARQKAPAQLERQVRAALHQQWRDMARSRRRRNGWVFAAAASVLVAVAVIVTLPQRQAPAPSASRLAAVDRQSGNVFVHRAGEPSAGARRLTSDFLVEGQVVTTAQEARLGLAWPSGESIRLDQSTGVQLVSAREIALVQGRIYVDSRSGPEGGPGISVKTPAGTVRHVGTQYMAGLSGDLLSVSVREGRVLVSRNGAESAARPGERLRVRSSGAAIVERIATFGELWAWAEQVTPAFVLDGRSAFEFIRWVCRETGRQASYASPEAEALARSTQLRGTIEMEPMRALDLILQTSDLEPTVEEGLIVIGLRQER